MEISAWPVGVRAVRRFPYRSGHPNRSPTFPDVPLPQTSLPSAFFFPPLPMWPSTQLDSYGHHRAACGEARVLGGRGFPVETAVARVCTEGGGRVSTNIMVRDMDVPSAGVGAKSLSTGSVCSTVLSWPLTQLLCHSLRRDGTARPEPAARNGAA